MRYPTKCLYSFSARMLWQSSIIRELCSFRCLSQCWLSSKQNLLTWKPFFRTTTKMTLSPTLLTKGWISFLQPIMETKVQTSLEQCKGGLTTSWVMAIWIMWLAQIKTCRNTLLWTRAWVGKNSRRIRTSLWPLVYQTIAGKSMLKTYSPRTRTNKTRCSNKIAYNRKTHRLTTGSNKLYRRRNQGKSLGTRVEIGSVHLQTRIRPMICSNSSSSTRYLNRQAWARPPLRELWWRVGMQHGRTRVRVLTKKLLHWISPIRSITIRLPRRWRNRICNKANSTFHITKL